jgi:N-methylhydantoinase A
MHFGVDTGGTFTDVVQRGADGRLRVHKLLSTPDDPSSAIADGVNALRGGAEVAGLVHGTTVATNALLERQGARVAFVTTEGFQDLLALRRQTRPDLYALRVELPDPLVPPERCIGVRERIAYDGRVLQAPDDDEVARIVDELRRVRPDAVAICLLHAYANDAHEQTLAAAIRDAFPSLHVTASSDVVREFREYERASTTAVNAFVGPVMSGYIASLGRRLPDVAIEILQSSGGRTTTEEAKRLPVHTVLSGPAGGVVGALAAAREAGIDRIISFDMGGTSTDVSLCDGDPTLSYESEIDDLPIRVPVLDIFTVGAGGGSIAYRDPGGALRVGPRSAGADPGPACYGRGGSRPTVTDAHLVLGRLRPDRFLAGEMTLDVDAARHAVDTLAADVGLSREETARGILEVADAAMVRAIKVISVRRGHDPRDFALVSFGGAGGLHACRLAEALGMRRVLVPANPGLLSAYGMLHADRERLFSQSVLAPLERPILEEAMSRLARRAKTQFDPDADVEHSVDLRYVGQSFEITVAVRDASVSDLAERFASEHERRFGYRDDERGLELVAVRCRATVPSAVSASHQAPATTSDLSSASEQVFTGDSFGETSVVERSGIATGAEPSAPAVVTEYSGTTVIPAGWTVTVRAGHLLLEKGEAA